MRFGLKSPKTEKMVHLLSIKEKAIMANEHLQKYLRMTREVSTIFDDLDNFLNFCRFELLPFNEADLYNRGSASWRAYENSKRPRREYGDRREWKPRGNNSYRSR